MAIEITGIPRRPVMQGRLRRRLEAELGRLRVKPVQARVSFIAEHGPKGGPDVRCALTVRLPRRPLFRAEHVAENVEAAFDPALAALERQLRRARERGRELRRHPKKYFVAARLREAGEA